uniref:(California timema) hypothetical protein n=1 Tax=Timema californicum TaxID=61474 RepID=A0A7R9JL17_TIMCA|nr:unnamed protein product [Timema californicum]
MNLPSTRDSNQDLRERHGQWDPVTPRVYCPLACSWSGEQGDLKAHIMEDHADRILDDSGQEGEHVKTWKLALRVTDKRVIFTQREVFLYRQKLNTLGRVFHVGVQYLGPVSNAATFKYEVELSAEDDHQKFVKFRQTLGEDEDIEAAILTGNSCINVDYEIVKTFTSKKNFSFSVKISSW